MPAVFASSIPARGLGKWQAVRSRENGARPQNGRQRRIQAATLEAQRGPERTEYTPELGERIAELIADGTPLEDTKVNGSVVVIGVCSQVGASRRTIYRWQKAHTEFAEAVNDARTESSHRLADRINALAQLALDQPTLAQAVKVAAELYKWSAATRNPETYGARQDLHIHDSPDLGERLRRAKERGKETEAIAPAPEATTPATTETPAIH
jgi:hypothetical protein